jgi:hypothetical protein
MLAEMRNTSQIVIATVTNIATTFHARMNGSPSTCTRDYRCEGLMRIPYCASSCANRWRICSNNASVVWARSPSAVLNVEDLRTLQAVPKQ